MDILYLMWTHEVIAFHGKKKNNRKVSKSWCYYFTLRKIYFIVSCNFLYCFLWVSYWIFLFSYSTLKKWRYCAGPTPPCVTMRAWPASVLKWQMSTGDKEFLRILYIYHFVVIYLALCLQRQKRLYDYFSLFCLMMFSL